ncbi:hypothetical protein ACFXPZ_36285 [Streptomyces sp. NPDC059101]|uniref:hypothetical protein n=1 Tax=unclassified Streptomyces TaxID=2593676 RepID=UPI0035B52E7B
MSAATELTPDQARTRLAELTVVDVRTPGAYASGQRNSWPGMRGSSPMWHGPGGG